MGDYISLKCAPPSQQRLRVLAYDQIRVRAQRDLGNWD
jgi:hypothetical protein